MTKELKPERKRRAIRFFAYWFNLFAQPLFAVAFVIALAWLFGYLQRNHDWFNTAPSSATSDAKEDNAQYACSMLCVFLGEPGRCPVCGMELQEIERTGDPKDLYGVTIDPAARRLANIKTVAALNIPIAKDIEVLGRIEYDESTVSTVSAYVDGRIEDLFVDYTGATIRKGDELAVIYSPDLYSDQVGLLQAKAASIRITGNDRVDQTNKRLYQSARRRLSEQGIPESEINNVESAGKPNSRIKIYAPVQGTVIKKLIDQGQYIKQGMPILKIADLATVWLMLELHPDDTENLKIGQAVSIDLQSQPGTVFEGKVSFIAPMVDSKTQTVAVRVAIANDAGLIKIGDLGKAKIRSAQAEDRSLVVVPRESVLVNGTDSVAYVETEPGRFEFRQVKVAEVLGDKISISDGIRPGEQVVASGTFMLDSTFNIQGKVSLIDPSRAAPLNLSQLAKDKPNNSQDDADDLPQMDLPEMAPPEMALPEMAPPEMALPEMALPEMAPPTTEISEPESPEITLPDAKLPQMELPDSELPQMELPE